MNKYAVVTLLAVFFGLPAWVFAPQSSTPPAPPSRWIPFTARIIESNRVPIPTGGYMPIQSKGVYARNESGVTYSHLEGGENPPLSSGDGPDVAFLTDRPNRAQWAIDFQKKTAKLSTLMVEGHPDLAALPMTQEIFDESHAEDLPLGRKVISGMECKGYRIRDPKSKKTKYMAEIWYAPALNFVAVKSHTTTWGNLITVTLEDIQTGKDPDPDLFRIPPGFKVLR